MRRTIPANFKFDSDPHLEPLPQPPPQLIPEFSAAEESFEERHWRSIVIGGVWHRIDMKVIAPYKKVSHLSFILIIFPANFLICRT